MLFAQHQIVEKKNKEKTIESANVVASDAIMKYCDFVFHVKRSKRPVIFELKIQSAIMPHSEMLSLWTL